MDERHLAISAVGWMHRLRHLQYAIVVRSPKYETPRVRGAEEDEQSHPDRYNDEDEEQDSVDNYRHLLPLGLDHLPTVDLQPSYFVSLDHPVHFGQRSDELSFDVIVIADAVRPCLIGRRGDPDPSPNSDPVITRSSSAAASREVEVTEHGSDP